MKPDDPFVITNQMVSNLLEFITAWGVGILIGAVIIILYYVISDFHLR